MRIIRSGSKREKCRSKPTESKRKRHCDSSHDTRQRIWRWIVVVCLSCSCRTLKLGHCDFGRKDAKDALPPWILKFNDAPLLDCTSKPLTSPSFTSSSPTSLSTLPTIATWPSSPLQMLEKRFRKSLEPYWNIDQTVQRPWDRTISSACCNMRWEYDTCFDVIHIGTVAF